MSNCPAPTPDHDPEEDLRFIPKPQVSRLTGLSDRTLSNAVRAGEIPPPIKIRGRYFWKLKELQVALDRLRTRP
jgi:predicted DNA-binding transcriptional regulator AlpA